MSGRNWKLFDDISPTVDGTYIVIWSNPYGEAPYIGKTHVFLGSMLDSRYCGANEMLYWLDEDIMDFDICKKLRTRRVSHDLD